MQPKDIRNQNSQIYCILLFTVCVSIAVISLYRLQKFPRLCCSFPFSLPLRKNLCFLTKNHLVDFSPSRKAGIANTSDHIIGLPGELHTVLCAAEPPYCCAKASPMLWYISMRAAAMLLSESTFGLSVNPSA